MLRYCKIVILLLLVTLLSACSGGSGSKSTSGTTDVTVALEVPATDKAIFKVMTSSSFPFRNYTSRSRIPAEVTSFVITTTGAEFDPIVVYKSASSSLFPAKLAVPNGKDRTIRIEGKNSGGSLVYVGTVLIPSLDGTPITVPVSITFVAPLSKLYGGRGDDEPKSISTTVDDGYFMVGQTINSFSLVTANSSLLALKTRSNGSVMWQKGVRLELSTDNLNGYGFSTGDGSYLLAGARALPLSNKAAFVSKLDSNGEWSWKEEFTGPFAASRNLPDSIGQTSDKGYIVAASTNSFGLPTADLTDFWVIKLNQAGSAEWHTTIGGTGSNNSGSDNMGAKIIETSDGGYMLVALVSATSSTASSVCMIKLDAAGNVLWSKSGYTLPNNLLTSPSTINIQSTADGGYIVAVNNFVPSLQVAGYSPKGIWIFKTDATGGIVWQNLYGSAVGANARRLVQTADGGSIVTGSTMFKLNASGKVLWNKTLHISATGQVAQARDGSILSLDSYSSSTVTDKDIWLLKIDPPTAAEMAAMPTLDVVPTTISPVNRLFTVRASRPLGEVRMSVPNFSLINTNSVPADKP